MAENKNNYMEGIYDQRYRAAYSSRRAFRDELCLYGMKKQAH